MSSHPNFAIISTTPPPLDITDNIDDEDDEEFGSFNVLPENDNQLNEFRFKGIDDKELDFNISKDLKLETDLKTDSKPNNKISDNELGEELSHNNINIDNNGLICKNPNELKPNHETADKISLKSIEFLEPDFSNDNSISYDENDAKLESNEAESYDSQNSSDNTQEIGLKFDEIEGQELPEFPNFVENDDTDNQYCDYKENNELNNDDDSDFADFTSFRFTENEQFSNVPQNQTLTENKTIQSNDINFEASFGDFNTYNLNNNSIVSENAVIVDNIDESDDDFADFASADPVTNQSINTVFHSIKNSSQSDGEFADFTSFNNENHIPIVKNEKKTETTKKLSEIFIDIFPKLENQIPEEDSVEISRDLFHNADQNSKSLWKSIQNLEDAPSLKLRWSESHSFQLLLAALNIDPRNILRNSSVPMFASGLGHVLEPTKPSICSDNNIDNAIEKTEVTNTSTISSTIPAVQFDWSSSGLTNPLEDKKSNINFDLDFFVTNDDINNVNNNSPFSDSFEKEFLNDNQETNCKIHSISDFDPTIDRTNIVQQLLSSIKSSSTSSHVLDRNQVLNAEAIQVLDELPNLSFMRAKVLMFPINTGNDSIR